MEPATKYTFNQAIKAVLPHVAPENDGLPALSVVQVFEDRVVASDRYSLARSYFEPHVDGEFDAPFLLHIEEAKTLSKEKRPISDLRIDDGQLSIYYEDGSVKRVQQCHVSDRVPPLERLFPKKSSWDKQVTVMVRPKLLARLKETSLARDKYEKGLNVSLTANEENRPVYWTFSDHTDGLLMPSRTR